MCHINLHLFVDNNGYRRTLTHSMDGKRLRDPLHLRDLTCQPERNASPGISDSDALPGGDFFPSGPASMVSLSGSTLPSGSAFDISPSDETSGGTETETNNIALAPTSKPFLFPNFARL